MSTYQIEIVSGSGWVWVDLLDREAKYVLRRGTGISGAGDILFHNYAFSTKNIRYSNDIGKGCFVRLIAYVNTSLPEINFRLGKGDIGSLTVTYKSTSVEFAGKGGTTRPTLPLTERLKSAGKTHATITIEDDDINALSPSEKEEVEKMFSQRPDPSNNN